MPKYTLNQYGLSQYGRFTTRPDGSGGSARWLFVKSRFGIRKHGQTFWLYQHGPARFTGQASKIRLRTNTGEQIQEECVALPGNYARVRLRTNIQTVPLMGDRYERSTT